MLVNSCDPGRGGLLPRPAAGLARTLTRSIGRLLVASCLATVCLPMAVCLVPDVAVAQDEDAGEEGGEPEWRLPLC